MNQESLIFLRDFSTLFMELLCAITGSIYYYKYKDSILKYFLIYLWVVVFLEYTGYISREYFDQQNNGLIFNIYFFLSYTYISSLYLRIIKEPKKKRAIYLFFIIYIVSIITGGVYENYVTDFQSIAFITASVLIVLQVAFYFIELLNSERVLHVKKNLFFWISIGLLIFYIGNIPFRITINYYADLGGFNYLFSINYLLIILLNSCYIIGFIWSNKKQLY